ncbi:MAG TPA: signal peptidase I [Candidatus Acidoferrum sp.]
MKADARIASNNKKKTSREQELSVTTRVRKEMIAWAWVILAFLLINGTIGQARVIPSGSMENTLLVGDHLIMSRIGYDAGIPFTNWHVPLWKNPHRQQIVIFRPPYGHNLPDLIKRVIGLPGETIDVHDGAVWINGKKLEEDYTTGPTRLPSRAELLPSFKGLPFTVPENQYFVMGDNRGNSYDSRYWGSVSRDEILGTPVAIYMSVDAPGDAWNGDFGSRFRAYGNALLHPSTIRWKRLFETFR